MGGGATRASPPPRAAESAPRAVHLRAMPTEEGIIYGFGMCLRSVGNSPPALHAARLETAWTVREAAEGKQRLEAAAGVRGGAPINVGNGRCRPAANLACGASQGLVCELHLVVERERCNPESDGVHRLRRHRARPTCVHEHCPSCVKQVIDRHPPSLPAVPVLKGGCLLRAGPLGGGVRACQGSARCSLPVRLRRHGSRAALALSIDCCSERIGPSAACLCRQQRAQRRGLLLRALKAL